MTPNTYKVLTAGWSVTILFLTLSPGNQEPGWLDFIPHFDKLAHLIMFAVYALLSVLGWGQKKKSKKNVTILRFWIIGSGIVFAAATEMLQTQIPNRSADLLDWWADCLGLIVGLITYELVKKTRWSRKY